MNKTIEEIGIDLECPVCKETLPLYTTPCNHSFCKECLERIHVNESEKECFICRHCPLCRFDISKYLEKNFCSCKELILLNVFPKVIGADDSDDEEHKIIAKLGKTRVMMKRCVLDQNDGQYFKIDCKAKDTKCHLCKMYFSSTEDLDSHYKKYDHYIMLR